MQARRAPANGGTAHSKRERRPVAHRAVGQPIKVSEGWNVRMMLAIVYCGKKNSKSEAAAAQDACEKALQVPGWQRPPIR